MDNEYAGMTVNERLFVSGLLAQFDEAIRDSNAERARSILEKVELTEKNIMPILKNHGLLK